MQQIKISDHIYQEAQTAASESGFESVDAYIEDVISMRLREDAGDFDHRFTPEVLADLDRISAEIDAGAKTYTLEEVDASINAQRDAWLKDQAS